MSDQHKDLCFDAVIPVHLLLNKNVESGAKIFYGIVRSLSKMHGYCYANNFYLSELMGVDERTIQNWLATLEVYGYVERKFEENSFNPKRMIYISDDFKKYLQRERNFGGG